MIRVLHFGLSSSLGGIETYLRKITTHINKDEFQFDFLVMGNEKPCYYDELLKMGCRFYRITKRSENLLKNRRELDALFKKEKFDIVHCHLNSLSNISPVTTALNYKNNVIVHSRNANTPKFQKTKILHFLNSYRLPKDKIIKVAVSEKAGKWMFGDNAKFKVINNGIDVELFKFNKKSRSETRRELGIEDKYCVTNVGAFRYQKNHLFLLEIFKYISELRPNSVLLLVGEGALKEEIKAKASELGINKQILMLGNRSDVPDILSASDVFLFPSFYEGFPNALLEAQTSGLPALFSDTITDEVSVNNNCQSFSLNKSPKDWAEKLLSLGILSNREIGADTIAQKGFSVKDEVQKLEGLYYDVLK